MISQSMFEFSNILQNQSLTLYADEGYHSAIETRSSTWQHFDVNFLHLSDTSGDLALHDLTHSFRLGFVANSKIGVRGFHARE